MLYFRNYFKNGAKIMMFLQGGKKYGNVNVRYKDNIYNFEDPYNWKYGSGMVYYYDTPEGYDYQIQTTLNRGGGLGFSVIGGTNVPEEIRNFNWYNGGSDESESYGTPNNIINYELLYKKQYGNDWSHYKEFEKEQNIKRDEIFKKYFPNLQIK